MHLCIQLFSQGVPPDLLVDAVKSLLHVIAVVSVHVNECIDHLHMLLILAV